jgi:hypothetical protein
MSPFWEKLLTYAVGGLVIGFVGMWLFCYFMDEHSYFSWTRSYYQREDERKRIEKYMAGEKKKEEEQQKKRDLEQKKRELEQIKRLNSTQEPPREP